MANVVSISFLLGGNLLKYVGYYDVDRNKKENRYYPPAGKAKMEYIIHVLAKNEIVEIISASGVIGDKSAKASYQILADNIGLRRFHSIGRKNKLLSFISTRFLKTQLFIYLLMNTKEKEPLIVYHSLGYSNLIRWIKKLKHPRLILEMEELYADVSGCKSARRKEMKLASCADAFILPTALLNKVVNVKNKPFVIIHGTYGVEPDRHCNIFSGTMKTTGESMIHCVYAGTLDPRKGGAAAATAAAKYLPANYHIHILGFGGKTDVQTINDKIDEIRKTSKASVSYDGLLSGEDYILFLQSCDIGLSTQEPEAAFNATSFPSKILSYLANGLKVVTVRIPVIEQSTISNVMYYYDEQTPEQIAAAIQKANASNEFDSRQLISELAARFELELKKLINELQ